MIRGLAAAVVERIAPFAPAGLEISEQPEGFLEARIDESRWETYPLDDPDVAEDVDPETFDPPYPAFPVLELLDFLQEYVRTELGDEWEQGEPWAALEDGEIRFGYDGGISFDPIPVASLGGE
jgi:hypothetical protein